MSSKMQKDILIQARMGSTRLPGKVLESVGGIPLLLRTYNRVRLSKLAQNVVIISSTEKKDDVIEELCIQNDIQIFRGSENDLLDRHYQAALELKSDYVFKIPSDCPFSDPAIIDTVLGMASSFDYVSNYHPPTFPDGLDVEGAKFELLEEAWRSATKKFEREHTFPFIWDNPDRFTIGNLNNELGNMFLSHRWTLDYPEDLEFVKRVYREFDYDELFGLTDILALLESKPEIKEINNMYNGVNWYRNEINNLKTVSQDEYRQEPRSRSGHYETK